MPRKLSFSPLTKSTSSSSTNPNPQITKPLFFVKIKKIIICSKKINFVMKKWFYEQSTSFILITKKVYVSKFVINFHVELCGSSKLEVWENGHNYFYLCVTTFCFNCGALDHQKSNTKYLDTCEQRLTYNSN